MLLGLLVVIHVLVAVLLIIVILLQSHRGEGLSGAFGVGMGSSSVFGADTANVLSKTTAVLAAIFMITTLSITWVQKRHSASRAEQGPPRTPESATSPAGETKQPAATPGSTAPSEAPGQTPAAPVTSPTEPTPPTTPSPAAEPSAPPTTPDAPDHGPSEKSPPPT